MIQNDTDDATRARAETLMRALEIIAVGDSKDPAADATEALVDAGCWQKEPSMVDTTMPPLPEPFDTFAQLEGTEIEGEIVDVPVFTAEQMHAYAKAAIAKG